MEFLIFLFIFILGLIVGSFLNCVIYRLEQGKSFVGGRSFCPHCKHVLGGLDLIPVLSFLILRGKCRYCQKPISLQYPLVELATAILFVSIFRLQFGGDPFSAIFSGLVACFLIIIFVYDLKYYIIPDKVVYPAIAVALIFNFQFLIFNQFPVFKFSILSAVGAAAFFLFIVLVSKGKWMGVGDIKLAFLMGLVLGFPNILVALFLAFFIGAIIGIGLIVFGRKTFKSEVPFGPFLVAGTFLALFFGKEIINWYLNLILL